MEAHSHLYLDLTYIFLAAMAGGLAAWRLRLPLILGFVLGGIAISPYTPGLKISDVRTFEHLSEAGVVLLMFSIGAEFSMAELLSVKWIAVAGGACGIAASLALAAGVAELAGWSLAHGLVIGATVSVASTMVLVRLLTDGGALAATPGRVAVGISLFEDLAVVLMTVMIPAFAGSGEGRYFEAAKTLGRAVLLFVPLCFMAMKVIPGLLRRARDTGDTELFLLTALSVSLGTAALSQALGFSMALGAFLAGFSISECRDLHSSHAQLFPVRNAFVAMFFVSLGTLIQPEILWRSLPLVGVMLLLIVPGKFLIWLGVVKLFRYPTPTAIAVAAGLAQIGELSFVIVHAARAAGLVGEDVFIATLAASLVSIFVNVFLVRWALAAAARRQTA
jgi:CPA2 family monovalent cation:H+ antiporter-2